MSDTIIGPTMMIEGEVVGEESISILGNVKGRIETTGNIDVEVDASVEAEVDAALVTIGGSITGNIRATEKAEILESGQVIGNIKSPRISIADGAVFKGQIDMDMD